MKRLDHSINMTVARAQGCQQSVVEFVRELVEAAALPNEVAQSMEEVLGHACSSLNSHGEGSGEPLQLSGHRLDGRIVVEILASFPVKDVMRHGGGGAGRKLGLALIVSLVDELSVARTRAGGTLLTLSWLLA